MPSAHGQNNFIMEKQTTLNSVSSAQSGGESCTFICTECGDGFSQYSSVLTHMTIHGPLESFTFDGSSYGFEIPREYVLQENGTLTIVNGRDPSHFSNSSVMTVCPEERPPQAHPPTKPASPTLRSQSSSVKDVFRPRPSNINMENSKQGSYTCEICYRVFTNLQGLHRHQRYRNTERGYKCSLCCKVFKDRQSIQKHLQDHFTERFKCCGHCGKRFLKIDALNTHQKENHSLPKALGRESKEDKTLEKAYTCKKCKLSFFWMSDLQTHSFYHCKGKEPDTEVDSDFEFEDDSSPEDTQPVNNHSHEPSNDTKNGDSNTLKSTTSEKDLAPTITPYRCGLCGDRFEELTALKQHHLTHQTQEEIDELNKESQLILKPRIPPKGKRRRSNQNGKLHPCKHCHRVFNHSSSLSRHMRYHKGTMHTCVFCGRNFPQRCDLRRHLIMYHKPELDKKPGLKHIFMDARNGPSLNTIKLQKNDNTADENTKGSSDSEQTLDIKKQKGKPGRGNYKCQDCGKKFGLLCVYQRHLRYHKKEHTKCPMCPALFKNASLLELHLKNHPSTPNANNDGQASCVTGTNEEGANETEPVEDLEEESMDQDQADKENSTQDLYECTECTKTFSSLDMFLQHQTSHESSLATN